ncbi:MAG TPA: hypothetical protein PK466_10355 [Thermotogota bacterium]|nr:hypothetical protein [Thermotogota bacterium]HPJ88574.1 hypothetical protein [Thermotogota bacterium]HPR96725.1 hypothetical protein [Thermotogota bacterium]
MNKLGIKRLFGILLALTVVIAAFVVFNVLPYIQMNDDLYRLESNAQRYDNDYNMFLQRNREIEKYKTLIQANVNELQTLKELMRKNGLSFVDQENSISFSGVIALDKLSSVLNYLSVTKELKVNTLDFKSQTELPLLIGEGVSPEIYINRMEIERIRVNEQVLGG